MKFSKTELLLLLIRTGSLNYIIGFLSAMTEEILRGCDMCVLIVALVGVVKQPQLVGADKVHHDAPMLLSYFS